MVFIQGIGVLIQERGKGRLQDDEANFRCRGDYFSFEQFRKFRMKFIKKMKLVVDVSEFIDVIFIVGREFGVVLMISVQKSKLNNNKS